MATPVVVMGLGELGCRVARAVLASPGLELVAAVDTSAQQIGRPLGDVLQAAATPQPVLGELAAVKPLVEKALRAAAEEDEEGESLRPLLLHTTGARLEAALPQLEQALRQGFDVVSSCEELCCPWVRHPRLADRLDRLAERQGVTLLGAGVDPGFVLDRLLATLAQATGPVDRVEARRVVDIATLRASRRARLGLGLSEAQFAAAAEAGRVGHLGLMESAALAAMGVGHESDEVDEELLPVLATRAHATTEGPIAPGAVAGVHQVARAFCEGREVARLELLVSLESEPPVDALAVIGEPTLRLHVPGGVCGESSAAWALVNAAVTVSRGAAAGLLTVLELSASR